MAGILVGEGQGAEEEGGARIVEGAGVEGVEEVGEDGLDGFGVIERDRGWGGAAGTDGMAAELAVVEETVELPLQSGGAAALSVGLDVVALRDVEGVRHG